LLRTLPARVKGQNRGREFANRTGGGSVTDG
jgi:hypothetical protein